MSLLTDCLKGQKCDSAWSLRVGPDRGSLQHCQVVFWLVQVGHAEKKPNKLTALQGFKCLSLQGREKKTDTEAENVVLFILTPTWGVKMNQ